MKLHIQVDESCEEVEITIKCPENNESISRLVDLLNSYYIRILGKKDGQTTLLNIDDIYYFEAVENHVYAYTMKEVYEVNYKLQELSEMLSKSMFVQTARTLLLNIAKIKKINPLVNGRILAELDNGEKTIITRVYARDFKMKLRG